MTTELAQHLALATATAADENIFTWIVDLTSQATVAARAVAVLALWVIGFLGMAKAKFTMPAVLLTFLVCGIVTAFLFKPDLLSTQIIPLFQSQQGQ